LQHQPVLHGIAPVVDLAAGAHAGRPEAQLLPAMQGLDGDLKFKGEIEAAFDTDVERRPAAAPAETQTSASAVEPPQPAEAPQSDDPPPVRP